MGEAVFGPVSQSRTSDGLVLSIWVVPDRAGNPHVVTIEPAPWRGGPVAGLVDRLPRALHGTWTAAHGRELVVRVDRQPVARLPRPSQRSAFATEPLALADGTPLVGFAEGGPDGVVFCDLYVDGRSAGAGNRQAVDIATRAAAIIAEGSSRAWAEAIVVAAFLFFTGGLMLALEALIASRQPLSLALGPLAGVLAIVVAWRLYRSRDGLPDSAMRRGLTLAIGAIPLAILLVVLTLVGVARRLGS